MKAVHAQRDHGMRVELAIHLCGKRACQSAFSGAWHTGEGDQYPAASGLRMRTQAGDGLMKIERDHTEVS